MTLLTPEAILRQILDVYTNQYGTSLATVEANWVSIEDIDLVDFVTRTISADPSTLDKQWLLPALAITDGPMIEAETSGRYQQMRNLYDLQVICTYFLQHPDGRQLSIIINRHIEATLDLFRRYPGFGYKGNNEMIVPGTTRFIPSRVTPRGNTLAKGLMVQFNFRFLQYGA